MTDRLLDALDAQPGDRVLEVGAGLGEVGEAVAGRVRPEGEVVITDVSPGMLESARQRIGLVGNASFRIADVASLEFAEASFDRAVARFALMLVPDPAAGLQELRRVLRPGGRLAFAVWTAPDENPWGSTIGRTLLAHRLVDPPEPDSPGPFRLADADRLRALVRGAGFAEPHLEAVPLTMSYESPDHYLDVTRDLSQSLRDALARLSEDQADVLLADVKAAIGRFDTGDGLAVPGRAWVVAADA